MVYFISEYVNFGVKVSPILSVVSLSLTVAIYGKSRISKDSDHAIHTFWRYIEYSAETIIFLMAGIIVGEKVLSDDKMIEYYNFKLLGLYFLMMLSRFLSIVIFYPLLKRIA